MCVNGASWFRENILEKYPEEEVTVYAVWFNMVPGDRKDRWDPELLSDKRVRHYWDEDRALGQWITENVGSCDHLGPIDWDSYYLFDGDGKWDDDTLGPIESCGTPVISNAGKLAGDLKELWKK